jgi:ABC-type amino acid transport substrate-binding protein
MFTRRLCGFAASAALAAAVALGGTVPASASDLELVKDGKLTVGFNGDMPGTGWQDGGLIGIDGEIMMWVIDELGLEVEPALMEWAALIASIQARRIDVMHGMMGWTEARTEVIAITDPIYYAGANISQRSDTSWSRLEDLEGKSIATIQGFGWIPELRELDADLALYDTSDAAVRDLLAGRVDAVFLDPPLAQWVAHRNPDWDMHSVPIENEFDPEMPTLTGKYMVVFGYSKEAPELGEALNAAIAKLWETCTNIKIAEEYGFADRFWFTPPEIDARAGVDRPEDWEPPTLPDNCE